MAQKITIVEDDEPIREMYRMKLEAKGYEVSTANDGASALHVLEHEKPDLILLDIRLPHLPGNEVLKRVRATEWGKNMKVIILTNISKSEASPDFRFLYVDRYIVKAHYTPSQVLDIINQVLNKK
jgi:DNA-binding response OmpR family regulator